MTLKTKMSLLLFLTSISIVSIGFSSWSITAETTAELNGNIQVDNVSDSKEFVYLDDKNGDIIDENNNIHSGIDTIDYCETSFMDNDGLVNDTGQISLYFLINQAKCKSLFVGASSLKLSITIKYSDNFTPSYNIFDSNYDSSTLMSSFSHSVECGKTFTESTPYNIENFEYTVDFSFPNILSNYDSTKELSEISFTVNYSVFSKIGDYFTNNIYSLLSIENMQFTMRIALSAY